MEEYNMKRLTFIIATAIAYMVICYPLSAQNMTDYELKRSELAAEGLMKITEQLTLADKLLVTHELSERLKEANGDTYQETLIVEGFILKLCGLGEVFQTEAQYLNWTYEGQALQVLKEIGIWYKQRRDAIEAMKTDEDIKRERLRQEQLYEEYQLTGIKRIIKREFQKWTQQGEFEKSYVLQDRLSTKSEAAFDSICFACINKTFRENLVISFPEGRYNADREGYVTKLSYEDKDGIVLSSVTGLWSITPTQAEALGNINIYWERCFAKGLFNNNGYLFPSIYNFNVKGTDYDIVLHKDESCSISLSEVAGDLEFYKNSNYSFDYTKYVTLKAKSKWIDEHYNAYLADASTFYSRELSKKELLELIMDLDSYQWKPAIYESIINRSRLDFSESALERYIIGETNAFSTLFQQSIPPYFVDLVLRKLANEPFYAQKYGNLSFSEAKNKIIEEHDHSIFMANEKAEKEERKREKTKNIINKAIRIIW